MSRQLADHRCSVKEGRQVRLGAPELELVWTTQEPLPLQLVPLEGEEAGTVNAGKGGNGAVLLCVASPSSPTNPLSLLRPGDFVRTVWLPGAPLPASAAVMSFAAILRAIMEGGRMEKPLILTFAPPAAPWAASPSPSSSSQSGVAAAALAAASAIATAAAWSSPSPASPGVAKLPSSSSSSSSSSEKLLDAVKTGVKGTFGTPHSGKQLKEELAGELQRSRAEVGQFLAETSGTLNSWLSSSSSSTAAASGASSTSSSSSSPAASLNTLMSPGGGWLNPSPAAKANRKVREKQQRQKHQQQQQWHSESALLSSTSSSAELARERRRREAEAEEQRGHRSGKGLGADGGSGDDDSGFTKQHKRDLVLSRVLVNWLNALLAGELSITSAPASRGDEDDKNDGSSGSGGTAAPKAASALAPATTLVVVRRLERDLRSGSVLYRACERIRGRSLADFGRLVEDKKRPPSGGSATTTTAASAAGGANSRGAVASPAAAPPPINKFSSMSNIFVCLRFLRARYSLPQEEMLGSEMVTAVVDGDLTATVDLVWLIALHFSAERLALIADEEGASKSDGKDVKKKEEGGKEEQGDREGSNVLSATASAAATNAGSESASGESDGAGAPPNRRRQSGDTNDNISENESAVMTTNYRPLRHSAETFGTVAAAVAARKRSVRLAVMGWARRRLRVFQHVHIKGLGAPSFRDGRAILALVSSAAPVECPYAPHHVPPAGEDNPTAANKRNHKQQAVREAAERREAEKCSAMNYAAALGAARGLFGAPLFWNPLDETVRVLADCPGEALILLVTELRLRFPPEDDEGKGEAGAGGLRIGDSEEGAEDEVEEVEEVDGEGGTYDEQEMKRKLARKLSKKVAARAAAAAVAAASRGAVHLVVTISRAQGLPMPLNPAAAVRVGLSRRAIASSPTTTASTATSDRKGGDRGADSAGAGVWHSTRVVRQNPCPVWNFTVAVSLLPLPPIAPATTVVTRPNMNDSDSHKGEETDVITVAVVHETAELFFKIYSVGDNGDDTLVGKLTVPVPLVKSCSGSSGVPCLSPPVQCVADEQFFPLKVARSFIAGRVGGDEGGDEDEDSDEDDANDGGLQYRGTGIVVSIVALDIAAVPSWHRECGVVTTDEDADGGDADEASGVSGKRTPSMPSLSSSIMNENQRLRRRVAKLERALEKYRSDFSRESGEEDEAEEGGKGEEGREDSERADESVLTVAKSRGHSTVAQILETRLSASKRPKEEKADQEEEGEHDNGDNESSDDGADKAVVMIS